MLKNKGGVIASEIFPHSLNEKASHILKMLKNKGGFIARNWIDLKGFFEISSKILASVSKIFGSYLKF